MSATNRPEGPLPPETAERVHAYLAAFLSPPAAEEVYDEVAEDVAFWGDLGTVQVFAAAHRALGTRLRIAPDVEVLVLAEDAEVPVDEISQILELAPSEVRAMLDDALAELAEPDVVPPAADPQRRGPDPEPVEDPQPDASAEAASPDGPTSDWPPALVADEPRPIPEARPVPAAADRTPPTRPVDDELPAASGAGASVEEEPAPTEPSVTPTPTRSPLREPTVAPTAADGSVARREPAAPSEVHETAPRSGRWVLALLVLGTIILIGVVIASFAGDEPDPSTAGIETGCADAPICVTEAVVTDSVNSQGVPGAARDRFTLDDDVKLWFRYDRNREGPVTLEVRWFRDGNELYRSDFRLAAVDRISLTLAGIFMEVPGSYQVQVAGDGQVLLERAFAIAPGAGEATTDAPSEAPSEAPDDASPDSPSESPAGAETDAPL